jgi:hypothetical protein
LATHSDFEVDVECDYCNNIKRMQNKTYNRFTKNGTEKYCCRDCYLKLNKITYEQVQEACENNGYVLVTSKNNYKNGHTYIDYICHKHGINNMKASNMVYGRKCPKCQIENASKRYRHDINTVIQRISECGGVVNNPEEYINQSEKNLLIDCPCCKNPFMTSLVLFTQHGGQLCENCDSKMSVGEGKIKSYLDKHSIEYEQEKWWKDCRDINPLPFDFYIPSKHMCIEFDGRQHFGDDTGYFKHDKDTIRHDKIKNDYCMRNEITLIRIPYWDINNIEKILNDIFYLHEDIV